MLCTHISNFSIKGFLDLEIFFKLEHFFNFIIDLCQ